MTKVDAFRKLIREEVRRVFREELKGILTELRKPEPVVKNNYSKTVKETIRKEATKTNAQEIALNSKDPIQRLLAETAYGMDASEYKTLMNASSDMAQGFPQMFGTPNRQAFSPEPQVVESVSEMLASTQPVHDINQVQIDVVPDFTGLMQTMKSKGQI